jgi:hypothetical protein
MVLLVLGAFRVDPDRAPEGSGSELVPGGPRGPSPAEPERRVQGTPTDSLPPDLPALSYRLTARPWTPLGIPPSAYLDRIEGECRFWIKHQDSKGALVDPLIRKEWQYSTPYFAHAVGTLTSAGRGKDLLEAGVLAMDHATEGLSTGKTDGHTEFYIAPLVQALDLYSSQVPASTIQSWRTRLSNPISPGGNTNNWRTYFMKGQWLRARATLISQEKATSDIESHWAGSQERRIGPTRLGLYHDLSSDPDTLAVEVVGRGNLLALGSLGYTGPSAAAIRAAAERGTQTALLTMDPSGQGPANGRTDNHVWGDVGHQVAFETLAERAHAEGKEWQAGQYRRAALLSFRNLERWRRTDPTWGGSFYVTKNTFDPALRVGYQPASQYSNYNGSLTYHTSEAYHTRKSDVPEHPAPVEIGGYAFATDAGFAAAFANAGGMAMEIDLRGDTKVQFANYWTALGVIRFGRPDWETRLGPSDGQRDTATGLGVSFAPTWQEKGEWIRLASVPERYHGIFSATFAHPLLVRCSVTWRPVQGQTGPVFQQEFTLTPDAVLSRVTQTGAPGGWGMTLPLLQNDGSTPLDPSIREYLASVSYPGAKDRENFIVLNSNGVTMTREPGLRTSYGDLVPVRATTLDPDHRTFIFPEGPGDPSGSAVRESFRETAGGFSSILGRVEGTLYVGRTSAGGVGTELDLQGKGKSDVTFSEPCGFILQLAQGRIVAVEADRAVRATIEGETVQLEAHQPAAWGGRR